jgi:O-antigen/teichoic acid export membrane protein
MNGIAGGAPQLLPRAVRLTMLAALVVNLCLALVAPLLLPLLFGPEFRDAVPMTFVLLAAAVPFTGAGVLSGALQADGAPLIPSVGEGLALVLTVIGLAVALKPWGGVGAAVVSLVSYSTSFLFQLTMARGRLGEPFRRFLLPTTADLRWARSLA